MKSIPLYIAFLLTVGCGGPVDRCLVSPMCGTIATNGEPVIGARVTRQYHSDWYNEYVETVTHTDAKGYFEFDAAWKKALVDILHQPVVAEKVSVECKGNTYTVLSLTKMDYDCFGELDALRHLGPEHGNDRLTKQGGKLYLKYDLGLDKTPIGQRP